MARKALIEITDAGKSSIDMCDQRVRDALQYKLGVDIPFEGRVDTLDKAYQVAQLAGKLGPDYRGPTSPMPDGFPNRGAVPPAPPIQVPTTAAAPATPSPVATPPPSAPQTPSALPSPSSTISTAVGTMPSAPQGATDLFNTANLLMKKQAASNQSNSLTS